MGEMLLRVMGRIGELSEEVDGAKRNVLKGIGVGRSTSIKSIDKPKHEKLGLKNKDQLRQAQFINNHPELVKETISTIVLRIYRK